MRRHSKRLDAALMEVVDNQLRDNDPPETKQTFARLASEGYSEEEARRLIANVVEKEIMAVLKSGRPYDHERFTRALRKLPGGPS